jgi:dTDP-4-dehydrorhamnose reductase
VRILVLGASGYVGGAVHAALSQRHEVTGTSGQHRVPGLHPLDVRDEPALRNLVTGPYDLVIHSAGLPDLSTSQRDPALARALNARSTEVIVDALAGRPTKLVYFSSDNVFPGTAEAYTEDDKRSPINAYGESKLAGEDATFTDPRHLVVRLPLMYGPSPYADRFLDRLSAPVTKAQTDITCAPLYLPSLPHALEALAHHTGVIHLAGPDVVTRYELMTRIQQALALPTEVVPVREADSPDPTLRPRRLVLRSVRHTVTGTPLDQALTAFATGTLPKHQ